MVFEDLRWNVLRATWSLGDDETGEDVIPDLSLAVASVHMTGDFDGSTVYVEVSNDGENWVTLTDKTGTDVSATEDALFDISNAAAYVRAVSSAGNGGAEVEVHLVVWR